MHISLFLLDALCIFAGFFIASILYPIAEMGNHWAVIASLLIPIYFGAALNAHAYATEVIGEPGRGVPRAVRAFLIATSVVLLVAFYLKASDSFSRVTFTLGAGLSLALIGVFRDLFLRKARSILGGSPYIVVLITDGSHSPSLDGVSMVIAADALLDPDRDSPEMYDRLAHALRDADRVIVACPADRRMSWVRVLKGANVQSEILAPELEMLAPLGIRHWDTRPTLVVADGPLDKFDAVMKRSFDLVVATVALVALAPLLIATAIAVKLESAGPVFFIQTRIGRGNRQFSMYKFRSMRAEQCDHNANMLTRRGDNRITAVGAIIRKTSIDELPQLFNVLLGDMSIVGPRPHALGARAADKLYWEVDDRYFHRHAAKPGLTGLAQIRGYRGATEQESDLTNRLQADLEYLNDWSIWKDIKILLMTFRVLVHKNAF
ncbi:MAG: exopolysaccharide biosynthesis polyprenyl glycosylphosphotransferase [Pseudomonadota bacterium]